MISVRIGDTGFDIWLTIKAYSINEACAALAAHGIEGAWYLSDQGLNLVQCTVQGRYLEEVADWFADRAERFNSEGPATGYPQGTLLFYQFVNGG